MEQKRRLVHAYKDFSPELNTRVDLTLKTVIDLNASTAIQSPQSITCASRLIDKAGIAVAQVPLPPSSDGKRPSSTFFVSVTEDLICRDVVRFLMRLNRMVLKRFRKGTYQPRLSAFVVLEYGPAHRRPHLHALIERPAHISHHDFVLAVAKAWRAQEVAHRKIRVGPVESLAACLRYNTKADDASTRIIYDWREPDATAYWRQCDLPPVIRHA